MAILGKLLKKGVTLRESLEQMYSSPGDLQKQELRNLLIHCQNTAFGKAHNFTAILSAFKKKAEGSYYETFKHSVPIFDYDKIYEEWWHRAKSGERDICWPGKIKYFALSSGTSGAPSKHIPITRDMLKSIRKTSTRQMLTMSKYDLPASLFSKGILMLGGSTDLKRNGHYFEGDLSGITTSQIPFWFQHFYKPGKRIAKKKDWNDKLEEIVKKAPEWDMSIIAGVPAWLQILLEKIIAHYNVKTIHDIWPNLSIFVHGGVSFEPYRKGFERLLSKPLIYMETYLASEGFIAFQAVPGSKAMRLVLNNGIFYEFIPFTEANFDDDGKLKQEVNPLNMDEVQLGVDYALLISTNAGAWRYMIGDVIRFASLEDCQITITGRTKLFMSLCGEHLSLDNLNKAVEMVDQQFNIFTREFTLVGARAGNLFAHHWYIGTDDEVEGADLRTAIDENLKALNDDYKVERSSALQEIRLTVLPSKVFYEWMEAQGKVGSQNKFPRVLKKEKAASWVDFVSKASNLKIYS
ncbi:MAG: GH3 auxin-responsive promoter family protein [Bacteroidota bacterium]